VLRAGVAGSNKRLLRMTVTIWHNPACGTSRNTLAMIRATGIEPEIIEYLRVPPDADTLKTVAGQVGGVRALLRIQGTPAIELGLDQPDVPDAAILAAMALHPILINRPVVIGPNGTVLARPSERVLTVLDGQLSAEVTKEDGEKLRTAP
jgi:arsenate reductase